mmetsp:Transcript_3899/g.10147  ORF Transcript_3899/g.10147 Transcript_3899/m.10147 type:complete len:238 (-) Transcript_3899:59-772(-)
MRCGAPFRRRSLGCCARRGRPMRHGFREARHCNRFFDDRYSLECDEIWRSVRENFESRAVKQLELLRRRRVVAHVLRAVRKERAKRPHGRRDERRIEPRNTPPPPHPLRRDELVPRRARDRHAAGDQRRGLLVRAAQLRGDALGGGLVGCGGGDVGPVAEERRVDGLDGGGVVGEEPGRPEAGGDVVAGELEGGGEAAVEEERAGGAVGGAEVVEEAGGGGVGGRRHGARVSRFSLS